MVDFINVIKRDPQVQINKKEMLDKYTNLSVKYQSKIRYDSLIQNVILKEIINIIGITLVDTDREIKMKISRIEYLECRFSICK